MPENDGVMSFDQLHKLGSGRVILSHEEWFQTMEGLTEQEKRRRIEFAEDWEDILIAILILIPVYDEHEMEIDGLRERMLRELRSLVETTDLTVNSDVVEYLEKYVSRFFEVTLRHLQDEYFLSRDRAIDNGNQETTTIFNLKDYQDAKDQGMKYKTWHTQLDDRVRDSHRYMEGTTILIDDLFIVGESMSELEFPRDWSHGADPNEIVNCRCYLTYSK